MSLRSKLLASYLIFVLALIVLGGWSALRLREMGDVSRRIISNNYDSVIAAQEMKESLERQDSAAVFALLGARERAVAQMREHRALFDATFQKAANNITEPGEPEVVETIRRDRDAYYQMFDVFLTRASATEGNARASNFSNPPARSEESAERSEYFNRLEPQFNKLRAEPCLGPLLLWGVALSVTRDPHATLPVNSAPRSQVIFQTGASFTNKDFASFWRVVARQGTICNRSSR